VGTYAENQAKLKAIADMYRPAGALVPVDRPFPQEYVDNTKLGYEVVGRIDSPEYKQVESELSNTNKILQGFPNDPRAQDWTSRVAAKRAALERIRSGK
jgi:hypothetical protein